jgi:hypothetical protein
METDAIDEAKLSVKRFANVFNLTYKRFLDLQKAEAQTHKANIETHWKDSGKSFSYAATGRID